MYRIKLASGEEAVYRTTEELAQAVASGCVSADANVFHNAANRWLPISLHPDYRAAVTGNRPAVGQQVASEDPGTERGLGPDQSAQGEFRPPWPPIAEAPASAEVEYDPTRDPTPLLGLQPVVGARAAPSRARKLRIMLALAMSVVGLVLMGGGAFVARRYLVAWLEQNRPHPVLREGMSPATSPSPPDTSQRPEPLIDSRTEAFTTRYPAPSPPLEAEPAPPHPELRDSASGTHTSRLPSIRNRTPSYFEAYADARAEMEEALDYIHFQRVFAPTRFMAPESLRATRRMVTAAANILRVYRGREVMMEQTYRPGDQSGKGSFREPFETAEATRSLLADSDSLLGILLEQQGRFIYDGESVRFQDPAATRAYATLRQEIGSMLADWRDSAASQQLVTMPRLLRALGGPSPPPLRK